MKNKYSIFSLIKNAFSYHENWEKAWKDPEPKKEYDAIIIGGGGHGLATAAYNAGPNRVKYWNKINRNPQKKQIDYINWIELIKFRETRNYVQRVLENYNVYRYVLEQKPITMKNFFKNNPLF